MYRNLNLNGMQGLEHLNNYLHHRPLATKPSKTSIVCPSITHSDYGQKLPREFYVEPHKMKFARKLNGSKLEF